MRDIKFMQNVMFICVVEVYIGTAGVLHVQTGLILNDSAKIYFPLCNLMFLHYCFNLQVMVLCFAVFFGDWVPFSFGTGSGHSSSLSPLDSASINSFDAYSATSKSICSLLFLERTFPVFFSPWFPVIAVVVKLFLSLPPSCFNLL